MSYFLKMIKECNVTVMVSDIDEAVRFYVEILGLKLKSRYGDQFVQIEAPGTTIALHPAGKHGYHRGPSGGVSIGLGVDDMAKEMARLKEAGIVFDGDAKNDGPVKLAFFSDPDGTPLYLSQQSWG